MSVSFHLATPADLDTLTDLVDEFTAEEGYPYDRAAVRAILARMLARDDIGRAWLIRDDGEVAGYVAVCFGWSIEFRGRDAFIDELFVRPAFRGRGHGTAAMKLVAENAPALGVRALHLEVERHNKGARRLYERLGYRDHQRHLLTLRFEVDGDEANDGASDSGG